MFNLYFYQIILFIILILKYSSNIIVIPFKILKKVDSNYNTALSFIENNKETTLYSNILLGDPPKYITSIISFNVEDFSMHHRINNLFNNTFYKRNDSKTFEKINYINKNPLLNIDYFKEQVSFYTDLNFKNKIKIKDMYFSLIEYEKEKTTKNDSSLCLNIGFQLSDYSSENIYNTKINTNIIIQLKQKTIISSYNFNFHFEPLIINRENFDGFIVLGKEPHQYLKSSYNEHQLYKTLAFKKDNALSWDIHFNKIYYLNSYNNKEVFIDNNKDFYNQATLTPSSSLIVGTKDYDNKIKFDFFDRLIYSGKCIRENQNYMIFYYCYKNQLNKEDLEQFPSLYFSNEELDYTFELDYKDLFIENGDLIYFLIIFYNFPQGVENYLWTYISRWELGIPFLKKYFFTYDYDNKYIGFYNNKKLIQINNNKKDNNNNHKKSILWIIIILLIILFCFLVILIIKKLIFKNKKITAIELENNKRTTCRHLL